jgi:hypothetical protein
MISSQSSNVSPFQPRNYNVSNSQAVDPQDPPQQPTTSGQRVQAPPVPSNAPNVPGGDGSATKDIGSLLKDALKDLATDLKSAGKEFVDSLKQYSRDVKESRPGKEPATPGASAPAPYEYYRDDRGRVRDVGGRFAPRGIDPNLIAPAGTRREDLPGANNDNDNDNDTKKSGGFRRGLKNTTLGLARSLAGSPGGELQSFLALAPGFARGAEGYGVAEGLARQAAAGELEAMQASMLLQGSAYGGFGGGSVGIRSALGGGTLLERFAQVGMSRSQAAGLLKGIAFTAGGTARDNLIGGMSANNIVAGIATGEDIPGYFSNIGGFQAALGEDARGSFALEFNRDAMYRGAQRTARQAQRQEGFLGLYTQNIGADRLSYNQLIDAMGGGSLARGQAIFQRGAGAAAGATAGLTADFSGVGASMLQADAMRRAGGDRLKALELLEADQAKGGSAMYRRLVGMGMSDRTARLTLAGMGLSTRDIQTLSTAEGTVSAEGNLEADYPLISQGQLAGEGIDRMLPMSRMFAENENKRVNLGIANRGRAQTKLDADLRVSQILINRSAALDKGLGQLITTVEGVVKTIDALNNATRDSFVDSMRAVQDPNTNTLDRIYHYGKMGVIMLLNSKAGL